MNIFTQIWLWISENIVPILSSTTFVTIIGVAAYWLKNRGVAVKNAVALAQAVKELKSATSENTGLKDAVSKLVNEALNQKDEIRILNVRMEAALDLLETVYTSQLKDTEVVKRVNAIATTARYAKSKTIEDIIANAEAQERAAAEALVQAKARTEDTKRIVGKTEPAPQSRVKLGG